MAIDVNVDQSRILVIKGLLSLFSNDHSINHKIPPLFKSPKKKKKKKEIDVYVCTLFSPNWLLAFVFVSILF